MILFHSLHVAPKQDYLDFIYFHSFQFLYFKTFNQGYLIPFHSILFHSSPLLKYIPFHSFHFHSLMIIPFHISSSHFSTLPLTSAHCPLSLTGARSGRLMSRQTPQTLTPCPALPISLSWRGQQVQPFFFFLEYLAIWVNGLLKYTLIT